MLVSLSPDVGLRVRAGRAGRGSEVANGLTGVAAALDQHGLAAGRGAEGQLVEGQDLTWNGRRWT